MPPEEVIKRGKTMSENTDSELCPECASSLVYMEGCKQCDVCGWSRC